MPVRVRLVIVTGPPGAGKTTFADRLATTLGPNWDVFRLDDYIGRGPGPWSRRRASHLPEIGRAISMRLSEGRLAIFDGVLVGQEEVPSLLGAAHLRRRQALVLIIVRAIEECWARISSKPGFLETERMTRTLDDFRRHFYEPYSPREIREDLRLHGDEVDGQAALNRVLERLSTSG